MNTDEPDQSANAEKPPALRASGLWKRYGHVEALRGVDVELRAGEIVGLVGDNGAGKSTFVKILAGVHAADAGDMWLNGEPVRFRSPHDARTAGIEVVYQDLALAPHLPIWGNMFLAREIRRGGPARMIGWLDKARMRAQAAEQLRRLDIQIASVDQLVEELSGGQRQAVAVGRGVAWGRHLVLLDEPTNNLGLAEQRKVLELITALAGQGVGVLMVSHNLEHVFEIVHRIVVFRQGKVVADRNVVDTSHGEVVAWITGLHIGA